MRMEKIQHWLHKWCWSTKTLYLSLLFLFLFCFFPPPHIHIFLLHTYRVFDFLIPFLISHTFIYTSLFFVFTWYACFTQLYLFFSSSTIWWSVWSGLLTSRPMLTSPMLKIKQGILNQSLCFACVGPYNFGGHLSVTSVWPDWSVRATKFYGQVGWYLKWIWPLILTP